MEKREIYKVGVDVGSTTLKMVVLDQQGCMVYKTYQRHQADFNQLFSQELLQIRALFPDCGFQIVLTGSAGMGIAERTGIPFVQEVIASIEVIRSRYPETQTLVDLGGEDAKMVFFEPGKQPDIRMNGNCAGGTGAFIDQMADLMNISLERLSEEALRYEKIYPVASRCGVFAKTDIQNLISRNVPLSDIAISTLQAVALQTITTLARGCDIRPKILCTGGPLTFIPALRACFARQLNLSEEDFILPEYSAYFPAWGAALHATEESATQDIAHVVEALRKRKSMHQGTLAPLFSTPQEYQEWKETRNVKPLVQKELKRGETVACFVGIDSGSTTTKLLVINPKNELIYSFYGANEGNPLRKLIEAFAQFYQWAENQGIYYHFLASAATGYGEELVKSALNVDYGIVETMAHLSGAQYVDPEVSFVLDIGGQDMKSIFTRDGVISNIELNEACSSGCGSFLQNFASTMNLTLEDFTQVACKAQHPSDLGSRCTVFMNSKVKQSLRENATLGDIAAGLAYSVVKNCLFKVLKVSNLNQLGDHIVVQGGTFRNDAVYRALELLSGKSVSSTDRPELMGALGAALYAARMYGQHPHSTRFTGREALPDPANFKTRELQCKGCTNRCAVLRFTFENGNVSYAGNKCEKVFFNRQNAPKKGYNAFDYKNRLLFDRASAGRVGAPRAVVGIPRVLNMFENYPFWYTLFTETGFEVQLSPESTIALYREGAGSVMSDNICFPAKLVHGHIHALVDAGVDRIFYPIVTKEAKEFDCSNNSYNCPVVSGYPEVIRSAMEPEERWGVKFDKPVINFNRTKRLEESCGRYFTSLGVPKSVFEPAFQKALVARAETTRLLWKTQKERFDVAGQAERPIFVVAGRPYHADPLIHQKVGQILSDLGGDVFTDDLFRADANGGFQDLDLVSQWSYPNRVIQAAMEVAKLPPNVQLIQLNSFGCGPDSFLMDEVGEVLRQAGKNHTLLRIDEIASPGSIRLRLRSLIESLKVARLTQTTTQPYSGYQRGFTQKDRSKTILLPWFADFLSPFLPALGELAGYRVVNLPRSSKPSADAGLKYGHNEVCYPSTLILGDFITALQSGDYDPSDVVVGITQTGGQCRATNYLAQIKAGLKNAGFSDVPVLVLSTGEVFQNEQSAFRLPALKLANIGVYGLLYADALQGMYSATVSKAISPGKSRRLFDRYIVLGVEAVRQNNSKILLRHLGDAVRDFNSVAIHEKEFQRIGLIGEIYVKYNDYGQAHLTEWLRSQNMEVVTPPLLDFVMQYFVNTRVNHQHGVERNGAFQRALLDPILWRYINQRIKKVEDILTEFRFYHPSESIYQKAEYASDVLDLAHQFGEGWNIAAEVACFARSGIHRVVCVQPFGCIANHIVAKGVEKRIKKLYPDTQLLYLDLDGGMAPVHLQNRLHFLIN